MYIKVTRVEILKRMLWQIWMQSDLHISLEIPLCLSSRYNMYWHTITDIHLHLIYTWPLTQMQSLHSLDSDSDNHTQSLTFWAPTNTNQIPDSPWCMGVRWTKHFLTLGSGLRGSAWSAHSCSTLWTDRTTSLKWSSCIQCVCARGLWEITSPSGLQVVKYALSVKRTNKGFKFIC